MAKKKDKTVSVEQSLVAQVRELQQALAQLKAELEKTNTSTTSVKPSVVKVSKVKKTAEAVAYPFVRYELWAFDEHDGFIVKVSNDYKQIVGEAKKYVTEENVANALASSERDENWTHYFIEPSDQKCFYAGNRKQGIPQFAYLKDGKWKLSSDVPEFGVFLGHIQKGKDSIPWYLKDKKGKKITLDYYLFSGKSIVFIKANIKE